MAEVRYSLENIAVRSDQLVYEIMASFDRQVPLKVVSGKHISTLENNPFGITEDDFKRLVASHKPDPNWSSPLPPPHTEEAKEKSIEQRVKILEDFIRKNIPDFDDNPATADDPPEENPKVGLFDRIRAFFSKKQ